MSTRSIWPPFVEVTSKALIYESDSRISDLRELITDETTTGVLSGLAVTVNGSDATKVDIALGSAFAPNGDFMGLLTGQTGLSLANSTLGILNYVLLVYDEVNILPEAHETDGTTRYTRATVSPRVVVLTAAQYAALPPTASVLSQNAKDRAVLVAVVTGTGGTLSSGNIANANSFDGVLQATQPTNITGVTIISVSRTTPTGNGLLSFNSTTKNIQWQAPTEGSLGVTVTLTTSGVYTVTSLTGYTISINVVYSQLPSSNKTDAIVISDIYHQTVPRFTGVDIQHRSLLGSGVPSSGNPHGMTLEDLSPGAGSTLEEHQDVMHANGIVRFSSGSLFASTVNTGAAPDTLTVTGFASGDIVYVNGKRIIALASSNVIPFSDGSTEPSTYLIYLTQDGTLAKTLMTKFPTGSSLYDKIQILDVYGFSGTTAYPLVFTNGGLISFNGGPTYTAPSVDSILRIYGPNRIEYVDLFVKGASTPGSTQTDSVTIYTSIDMEENLPVNTVAWSGSATGFLGFGWGAASSPNATYDKRLYGTLNEAETRKDAGLINTAQLMYEVIGDGVLARSHVEPGNTNNQITVTAAATDQLTLGSFSYPSATLTGGVVYVGGRRFDVSSSILTFTNNTTTLVYIDQNGSVQQYVGTWVNLYATLKGKPIVRLYEQTTSGGAFTTTLDVRLYTGLKRNTELGSVGLDLSRRAAYTSITGDAFTVSSGGGNGFGIVGAGNGTGGGVSGQGGATGPGVRGTGTGGGTVGIGTGAGSVGATGTGGTAGAGVIGGTGGNFTGGAASGVLSTSGDGFRAKPGVGSANQGNAGVLDSLGVGTPGAWVDGTSGNFGLVLKNTAGTDPSMMRFVRGGSDIGATSSYPHTVGHSNIINAWGDLLLDGGVTVSAGFNITSGAYGNITTPALLTSGLVVVTFATAFASTNYKVDLELVPDITNDLTVIDNKVFARIYQRNTGSVSFYVFTDGGGGTAVGWPSVVSRFNRLTFSVTGVHAGA